MSLVFLAKQLVKETNLIKQELKDFFQAKEVHSHEARWEHYLAWSSLGGEELSNCWDGWDKVLGTEVICYDGIISAERYQTIDLVDALTNLIESLVCDEEHELHTAYTKLEEAGCEDVYAELEKHPLVVQLKEVLMECAIDSVYWDW